MGQTLEFEVPLSIPDRMPRLETIKMGLHGGQILTSFLTVCMVGPIIGILHNVYGSSHAALNWTLFVFFFTFATPFGLVFFPWAYEHKSKFKTLAKFFLKPRTSIIFSVVSTVLWGTAGIATTVYSSQASTCQLDPALEKERGDSYRAEWINQCNLSKAAAGFAWMTCILWAFALVCSLLMSLNEKQAMRKLMKEHVQNRQSMNQGHEEQQGGKPYRPVHTYEDEGYSNGSPSVPFDSPYAPAPAATVEMMDQERTHRDSYYHASPVPVPEQVEYAYQDYQATPMPMHAQHQQPQQPQSPQQQPHSYPMAFSPMPVPENYHARS
ncbi:hypothetical protein BDF14DRAFT_998242 [Spinellus fusiger]|nr:hypothetical protein BDF14DRAFT_998242 [Spinellus fusiger]